jgi:hypothetical protein
VSSCLTPAAKTGRKSSAIYCQHREPMRWGAGSLLQETIVRRRKLA